MSCDDANSSCASPVIVPCTIEPFLSSIVTVSLFSFIKNLFTISKAVSRLKTIHTVQASWLEGNKHGQTARSMEMDVDEVLVTIPGPTIPSSSATITTEESYDVHREAHTPLIIDNGSTTLRWGFSSFAAPNYGPNVITKYKERRSNKPLLLFGDALDVESGARTQSKTPWEGDVLLNFDALVSTKRPLVLKESQLGLEA